MATQTPLTIDVFKSNLEEHKTERVQKQTEKNTKPHEVKHEMPEGPWHGVSGHGAYRATLLLPPPPSNTH